MCQKRQFNWKAAVWIGIYAAFVAFAVVLRGYVNAHRLDEVWGWDYRAFVEQISDWRWIGYFGFRHPGLGVVASPLVVLQHIWNGAYLLVMPTVATATAWLIWRMAGWIGFIVWLSFPTTWLIAGIPESFPLAQFVLVGSIYTMTDGRYVTGRWGHYAFPVMVCVLAVLNGLITLTNGIKPILAYVATCGDWKKMAKIAGVAVSFVLLGIGVFAVRAYLTGRGIGSGITATLSWIPENRHIATEFYGFFIRPVGLVQACLVYPAALLGLCALIRFHQYPLLITYASYLAVDVGIHCVIGWGMSEPWIFAPHWIWLLPLVIGRGWKGASKS